FADPGDGGIDPHHLIHGDLAEIAVRVQTPATQGLPLFTYLLQFGTSRLHGLGRQRRFLGSPELLLLLLRQGIHITGGSDLVTESASRFCPPFLPGRPPAGRGLRHPFSGVSSPSARPSPNAFVSHPA